MDTKTARLLMTLATSRYISRQAIRRHFFTEESIKQETHVSRKLKLLERQAYIKPKKVMGIKFKYFELASVGEQYINQYFFNYQKNKIIVSIDKGDQLAQIIGQYIFRAAVHLVVPGYLIDQYSDFIIEYDTRDINKRVGIYFKYFTEAITEARLELIIKHYNYLFALERLPEILFLEGIETTRVVFITNTKLEQGNLLQSLSGKRVEFPLLLISKEELEEQGAYEKCYIIQSYKQIGLFDRFD